MDRATDEDGPLRRTAPRRRGGRPALAALLVASLVATLVSVVVPTAQDSATAAVGSDFDPGFIISDSNFYDGTSLSGDQIQSFLVSRGSAACTGATCLKNVRISSAARPADGVCRAYSGGQRLRFSDVLSRVSAACGINPKVLLVTLEKEQSLITTATEPSRARLDRALGYGCPDTAPCDPAFLGLDRQVYSAARQFKNYSVASDFFTWFPVGRAVSISYQANAPECGSSRVVIQNSATAALYYYTPYQPNAAALRNLYGSGDACSAYGNRNFWRLFSDWFGSPVGDVDPRGSLDSVTSGGGPGALRVTGWAADPDTAAPVRVHLYVDGAPARSVVADSRRADIGRLYPKWGPDHGFDATLTGLSGGRHEVCAYGINVSFGRNALLGCTTRTVPADPSGRLDRVTATGPGSLSFTGWALDPDTSAPIRVHAYVDGRAVTSLVADGSRPDVEAAYPGWGAAHGYSATLTGLSGGSHQVCTYGINVGAGRNASLGCRTVVLPSGSPSGALDTVTSTSPGVVTASGWAIDPDTAASIVVHLYVDGRPVKATLADRPRSDVARARPGYGAAHGFSASLTGVRAGSHSVCAYGIDVGVGSNAQVGTCRTVTVR